MLEWYLWHRWLLAYLTYFWWVGPSILDFDSRGTKCYWFSWWDSSFTDKKLVPIIIRWIYRVTLLKALQKFCAFVNRLSEVQAEMNQWQFEYVWILTSTTENFFLCVLGVLCKTIATGLSQISSLFVFAYGLDHLKFWARVATDLDWIVPVYGRLIRGFRVA